MVECGQLELGLDSGPPTAGPDRRIDRTLTRLAAIYESMPQEERAELAGTKWFSVIVLVSRLRGMERAEEEALGRPSKGLADTYDRVVRPGENAADAILRTFVAVYD